jgi:hypothetical protein
MMIYRKGEVVQVTDSLDQTVKDYIGRVGKIEKVGDLENDATPFVVSFFSGGIKEQETFSHKELKLLNRANDQPEKQSHYLEARLYRMQKKI